MLGPKLIASVLSLILVSCGDVDSDDAVPSRISSDGEAQLSLWLAPDPVDRFDKVLVTLTAVDLKPAGEDIERVELERPLQLDLLGLDPLRPRVRILDLPLRDFEVVGLVFDPTRLFLEVDGFQHSLELRDSPSQRLIPLNFSLQQDRDEDLTVGLDLQQSLVDLGNDRFDFRPALRIMKTAETGSVFGTVDPSLVETDRCANGIMHDRGNAVYLFRGRNAPVQDIRDDSLDPLATAPVLADRARREFRFRFEFLPAGDFTAVFTCDAALDHPLRSDTIEVEFSNPFNVTLEARREERLDIF